MSGKILMVLVDGSESANKAFEKVIEFKKDDDTLYICHSCQFPEQILTSPMSPMGGAALDIEFFEQQKKALEDHSKRVVAKYLEEAKSKNATNVHSFVLTAGHPKEQVCEFAKEKSVNTIFVGTRGLGAVKKLFLGSFSDYILHHAECDVMLVK
eukprot:c13064_g1_i1.p1 GENE.c13064_g1_i1~~c13064_g1_i1.p1  ORF type:complete len:154 (+),score=70.23 c13064_g1_i1:63-524(+)